MSKQKIHPPVPPDCPYLKVDDGTLYQNSDALDISRKGYVYFEMPDDGTRIYLDGHDDDGFCKKQLPKWRAIIACVAEVYWMQRIRREECLAGCSGGLSTYISICDKNETCRKNAAAWRQWGESKR